MGFVIRWHVEKQIIYLKLHDVVTPEEVVELNRQTVEMARIGTQPVHIIIDTLGVTEFPANLRWVLHMMQHNEFSPRGWNVVVQNNAVLRLLADTILRVLGVPVHLCSTLEEAHAFLAERSSQAGVC